MLVPIVATGEGAGTSMTTITSAMTSSFTSIVGDMMSTIGGILPIVLPVVGAVSVIFLGVRLFKRLAK